MDATMNLDGLREGYFIWGTDMSAQLRDGNFHGWNFHRINTIVQIGRVHTRPVPVLAWNAWWQRSDWGYGGK